MIVEHEPIPYIHEQVYYLSSGGIHKMVASLKNSYVST